MENLVKSDAVERKIPIWEKFNLTIGEASQYFNIGEKKLRRLVEDYSDREFAVWNGNKVLIKRERCEKFLNEIGAI